MPLRSAVTVWCLDGTLAGVGELWPRPGDRTQALLARVRTEVLPRYDGAVVAFACGSRAMGFTDNSDLDVTLVWPDAIPTGRLPRVVDVADKQPAPSTFELPQFQLDRMWIAGEQVDVMHRFANEVQRWWEELGRGEGWRDHVHPWPIVAISGLRYCVPLLSDPHQLLPNLDDFPAAAMTAISSQVPAIVEEHRPFLQASAGRNDGLLFHSLLTEVAHCVLVAAFASHGHYYPFAKWLPRWLAAFGMPAAIGTVEQEMWVAPTLADRLEKFEQLVIETTGAPTGPTSPSPAE